MIRFMVWSLAMGLHAGVLAAPPMTPADAFALGKADGSAGAAGVAGQATSANAAANVPDYSTTNANSSYFGGGNGNPRTFGSARVLDCATTSYTNPRQQAECTAINQIAGDRTNRPITPIAPTDPTIATGRAIANNPAAVAGSFTSGYSACTTQTVTTPPVYETELCVHEKKIEPVSCQKTLTVTVTTTESCVPNTWYGGFVLGIPGYGWTNQVDVYCDMNRNDGMLALRFTPTGLHGACAVGNLDVPKAPFTVSDRVEWGQVCSAPTRIYVTSWWQDGNGVNVTYDADGNIVPVSFDTNGTYYEQQNCRTGVANGELTSIHHYKGTCNVTNYIGYEPGYTQGCVGDVCTYTFRMIDSRWGNQAVNAAGPFTPPKIVATETDIWDTAACDILQSRTLP